ncbi:MAG TPA: diguanylate cyclase [Nitrospirales bacterium]|nr:diguanylate cyclase [Nitrospirales bacterium]
MKASPTRKFSVSTKMLIALAGGLVMVSTTLTVMQYRINSQSVTAEWDAKGVEFARILKVAVQPLLEHGDIPGLRQAVTATVTIAGITSVTVVNEQGVIVADSHERDIGERLKLHLDAVRQALDEAKADLSWMENGPAGRIRYILTPIKGPSLQSPRPNPVLGAVLIGMDLSVMDALVAANLRYLLFVNGITFAALLLMFWIAIRFGLVQPLTALTQSVRSSPGALPFSREMAKASDEIGMLTETFARMTSALDESEALNRAVLASVTVHTAILDRHGNLMMVNPLWERYAKERNDLFPTTGGGLVNYLEMCRTSAIGYGEKAQEAAEGIESVLLGRRQNFFLDYRPPDMVPPRWFVLSVVPLRRESGGVVITHLDITDRKQAEEAVAKAVSESDQARSALDRLYATLPIGLMYLSADLRVLRLSQSMAEIFGRPVDEQLGQPLCLILPVDRWSRLQPVLEQVLQSGKPYYGYEESVSDLRAPGGVRHLVCDFYPERGADLTTGVHGVVQDVTVHRQAERDQEKRLEELEAKNRELDQMAIRDPLTGLYNRRFFDEALSREWQQFQRTGEAFTVIIMDVDAFKHINDEFGHETGDRALVQVAMTLRGTLRESDLVARLGGDEFAALLPRTDTERSTPVAEKLRDVVRRLRLSTSTGPIPVTLSLGVATVPGFPPVTSAAELLRVADKRMYDAKRLTSPGRTDG